MFPNLRLNRFASQIALLYAAIFLIVGTLTPFLPVWFDWKGLTDSQIGIVFAVPLFARIIFTPLISYTADKTGNRRAFLICLAWGSLVSVILLLWADGFLRIFLLHLAFSLFWTSIMPLTETMAMAGVRREGLDYGQMRLWGSLSFIAASLIGGVVVASYGGGAVIWLLVVAGVFLVASAHCLPTTTTGKDALVGPGLPSVSVAKVAMLIGSPLFLLFLLSASLIQAGHAVYYAFGTLHWRSAGISPQAIGVLWSVGVVAEIILFAYSRRVVERIGAPQLIVIAGLAAVVRWSGTAMDPSFAVLLLLQILHGLTFGAAHLGAVHFISASVPDKYAGTAQGLYSAASAGIFMGSAMAASGPLYRTFGGQAYWVMAAMGLFSLLSGLIVLKRWNGGSLIK